MKIGDVEIRVAGIVMAAELIRELLKVSGDTVLTVYEIRKGEAAGRLKTSVQLLPMRAEGANLLVALAPQDAAARKSSIGH